MSSAPPFDWKSGPSPSDYGELLARAVWWRQKAAEPGSANWRDLYVTLAEEYERQAARILS